MDVETSRRNVRKRAGGLGSHAVEHEQWKLAIVQDVVAQLDAIPAHVKSGASVSAARARELFCIALQLAKLASVIGQEDGVQNVYSRHLTARQEEIMLLLDLGVKPKEIAHQFTLSEATVRTHIRNARRLLDTKRSMRGKQS